MDAIVGSMSSLIPYQVAGVWGSLAVLGYQWYAGNITSASTRQMGFIFAGGIGGGFLVAYFLGLGYLLVVLASLLGASAAYVYSASA